MRRPFHDKIDWILSPSESKLVQKIVTRAVELRICSSADSVSLAMDITATHRNGCPLDLKKFLEFDDFNFAHDIGGIRAHIDRNDGTLKRCFLPRSSK